MRSDAFQRTRRKQQLKNKKKILSHIRIRTPILNVGLPYNVFHYKEIADGVR